MRVRKKPIEVEAVQYTGELAALPERFRAAIDRYSLAGDTIWIKTNTGPAACEPYDWLVEGVEGEIYPVPRTVFEATYEPAG